jgi:NADH-quinone oxidoreductase subunit G
VSKAGVTVWVDNVAIQADGAENLLQACLKNGQDLPYFCWHPAMGSVGACRQCAVTVYENAEDKTGRVVMACMTAPVKGMRLSIADPAAVAFRAAVIETVLTNHPHDCPVCEVGGDCHLQDMTVLTGHHRRRTAMRKRTHLNQELGAYIKHEMNRCIGCYRCVRFYQDYAGGTDFGVFGANRNVYFGRAEDGALESEFAGNLVEVCPTGVFVDKPFSAVARRKWDMRATPTVCPHCAVGCNITLQERGGMFRRVVNRRHGQVNGDFLCDRGRFGVGFLESAARLRQSRTADGVVLSHAAAGDALAARLAGGGVIGVGSGRATLEANFALRRLVGAENFYSDLPPVARAVLDEAVAVMRRVKVASLADAALADAVLVLGDDPAKAAPRLALALRQAAHAVPEALLAARGIPAWHDQAARNAAQGCGQVFIVATPGPSWLDADASALVRDTPDGLARLGFAVAGALDEAAGGAVADARAAAIAAQLGEARAPLVVAGGSVALVRAAANIVLALRAAGRDARLILLSEAANGVGLAMLAPCALDGPAVAGRHVVVLEGAPDLDLPGAAGLTVLDHVETGIPAGLLVAVGSFAESDGCLVNFEGRAQNIVKAVFGAQDAPQAWHLLRDAGIAAGLLPAGAWESRAALLRDMGRDVPELAGCLKLVSRAGPVPTLPHRASGRAAALAHIDVREPALPVHEDSAFGTGIEGAAVAGDAAVLWAPGWNSGQGVNRQDAALGEDVLLFQATAGGGYFALPLEPWDYVAAAGREALSDLSPAVMARRAEDGI